MTIQPARDFVLKLVDRCNLRCRYCYVFEFDREIAPQKPPILSLRTLYQALDAIRLHLRELRQRSVTITLHGGEPLLVGKARFRRYVEAIRGELSDYHVRLGLQTNAVLLDRDWLDLFDRYAVHFSISLDGPPATNDKFRITPAGRGTAAKVESAIASISEHPAARCFQGILAVADPASSGAEVYRYFRRLGLRAVDFLLPDGNYAAPPFHLDAAGRGPGEFLVEAFDAWFEEDDPAIQVRSFVEIIRGVLGERPTVDHFGRIDGSIAFIETDGGLIAHDVLRICGPPHDRAALRVGRDPIRALQSPGFYPWSDPAPACAECSLFSVCGGGYPPHRFDGKSFRNPSYYCRDLTMLIRHIGARVSESIAARA
jgi:uncharacterized protein